MVFAISERRTVAASEVLLSDHHDRRHPCLSSRVSWGLISPVKPEACLCPPEHLL